MKTNSKKYISIFGSGSWSTDIRSALPYRLPPITYRLLLLLPFAFCLLPFATGCSIPNLEALECTESRGSVKEFYSYHFGNDMKFSPENLKKREHFLTADFYKSLQGQTPDKDVFTNTADLPKAFRVGGCKVVAPDKTDVEVLVFWKDDTRSEQRAIHAEVVKQDGKWLINKVS